MLDPKNLKPGDEQFEEFKLGGIGRDKNKIRIQYDYRHTNGKLFTCIAVSLEVARQRRNIWIEEQ